MEELKKRILEAIGWCPELLSIEEEEAARDFFDTLDAYRKLWVLNLLATKRV